MKGKTQNTTYTNTYNITKALNGYIVWTNSQPVIDRSYNMQVFNNARTAFAWIAKQFNETTLLKEMEAKLNE